MFENSLIVSGILSLANWLYRAFYESAIVCWIGKGVSALGRLWKNSGIFGFFAKDSRLEPKIQSSVLYSFVDRVVQGILGWCTKIYRKLRSYNENSINATLYERFVRGSFVCSLNGLLAIFIFFVALVPHDMWNNMYMLLGAIGISGIYFLVLLSGRNLGKSVKGIWLPLLIFMMATVSGVLVSHDRSDSVRVLMFFVASFLICLDIYGSVDSYEKMKQFMTVVFVGILLTSVYAFYQRAAGVEISASLTDLTLNKDMPGRVFSTMGNPNNYAEFLVLLLPFCFAYALNAKTLGRQTLLLVFCMLPVGALLMTYSRSGWISFAIALVVFAWFYNKKLIPILIVVGLLCVPLLPSSIINRILTIGNLEDSSSSYRLLSWEGVLKMLGNGYALQGIGLGPNAFSTVYPPYAEARAAVAPHSHMLYLEILVEMGIVGLLSFVWFVCALVRRSGAAVHRAVRPEVKNMLIAGVSALSGIAFISMVEYVWFYPRVMFTFFVTAGLTMAMIRIARQEKTPSLAQR